MSVSEAMTWWREEWIGRNVILAAKRYARENGWGLASSALLHALLLLLVLYFLSRTGPILPQTVTRFVPVDVVRLGDESVAPSARNNPATPQQKAAFVPVLQSTSPKPSVGFALHKTAPLEDELDAKLRGLARLRQPDMPLQALDNMQTADTGIPGDGTVLGNDAVYSLRDYIRALVERRWSLNLTVLGNHNFVILLHVEIMRNGTVTKSEIVDQTRFANDAAFHEIALSARNAVLLSSPIALPPGDYKDVMDMTLSLNPRDTLR